MRARMVAAMRLGMEGDEALTPPSRGLGPAPGRSGPRVERGAECGGPGAFRGCRRSGAHGVSPPFTWVQTWLMTTEPSPTPLATRLTEPSRTSPTAKTPRALVS